MSRGVRRTINERLVEGININIGSLTFSRDENQRTDIVPQLRGFAI